MPGRGDTVDVQAVQLDALRRLIAALAEGNRYYGPILQRAGLNADLPDLETFTRRMPLTDKRQLVEDHAANPPYGSNLTFPLERYTRYSQTSGSTATPLRWLDTPQSWAWMVGLWRRVFEASGVTPRDRVLFAFSFGPFIGFWLAFEAAAEMGCLCIPGGGMTSLGRLRAILDNRVTVLCCTPTYAIHLGQTAARERIDLSEAGVRTIVVAGEPGGSVPATRAEIERLWPGATVFDHHGMTEIGPVSHACPRYPGVLRVIAEGFLTEVIDPKTAEPVEPGRMGELVLTNLGRVGSPLLRYRTGDVVRLGGPKYHERGEADPALVGGIIGRVDDMTTVRGVNVFPSAVDEVVRSVGGVAEYRVEVSRSRALPEMTLVIEPADDAEAGDALARRVEAACRAAFTLRVPVRLAEPGSLPRFELKARRWIET